MSSSRGIKRQKYKFFMKINTSDVLWHGPVRIRNLLSQFLIFLW
jgi:hypothetical protein